MTNARLFCPLELSTDCFIGSNGHNIVNSLAKHYANRPLLQPVVMHAKSPSSERGLVNLVSHRLLRQSFIASAKLLPELSFTTID